MKHETITFPKNTSEDKEESREKKVKKQSNVILNIVFPNSSYNNTNIGHEIIDIFGADNDCYYYYLNPNGQANYTPRAILSIVRIGKGFYKVLNKAEVEKLVDGAKNDNKPSESFNKQRKKYMYGGQSIENYLNIYNQEKDGSTLVTYECKKIYSPKHDTYIALKNSGIEQNERKYIYKLNNTDIRRALRVVNFDNDDTAVLHKIVEDSDNWNDKPIDKYIDKIPYIKAMIEEHEDDLFEVLGISSLEIPYSNFLKYILDNTKLTGAFLEEVFEDKNLGQINFKISREEFNIDLLFTNFDSCKDKTKHKIFIIENKIDSSITLSDSEATNEEDQVTKAYKRITKKENIEDDDIKAVLNIIGSRNSTEIISQLSKYYIYAVIIAILNGWETNTIRDNIKCALLCPEYAKSQYQYNIKDNYLSGNKYFLENEYRLVTYNDVYKFFKDHEDKIKDETLRKIFLLAIRSKAKEYDNSIELRMIERFYKMGNQKK